LFFDRYKGPYTDQEYPYLIGLNVTKVEWCTNNLQSVYSPNKKILPTQIDRISSYVPHNF